MIPLPKIIDQSGNEIGRIAPILASVNLNIVPLSSATLQLKKGDTIPTRALVEMFTINGSAGVFRARAPQYGYGDMLTTVELEHSISMLGDFIVNNDIEQQTTASSAISTLFSYYRGGMWVLGQNNVSSIVVMQTNHDSVLDSIMAIMEQIPDYMLAFDQSVFPWRLNIVSRPVTVTAEGRLSRNISSVQIIYDDSELCTRAYMAWLDGTEAVTYRDADTISQYGIVEKEISGYGEVDQATAQRIVNLYLAKHKNPKMSVEISAVDLSEATGETFDKFTLGSMLRLAMPDENVTVEEIITGLRFDDIYNTPYDAAITLAEKPDTVVNIIHEQEKAGGGFGAGGRRKKEEQKFKRFETFYTQTDQKFSWLATDSEWDELAQAGHVTAFTELIRTAHFVEDTAQKELPFDEWKPTWIAAHPEDASLSDEELLAKYQNWITTNPYAIYNNEYSDATRTERIISKTGINSLGENETVLIRITQEADRVESSVYASQSQVYSAIGQTASNIRVELADTEQNLYNYIDMTASGIRQQITNAGNRTIVNDTDPRGATYTPKEGDIWIESVHDGTWDGADGFDWEHDEDYDWTQVQGAKAWVWKNNQWQLVADRQQLVTYSDFVNTADVLISQKISELANEQGQVEVYRSLIEQSAEQIRAEVYGATSNIYTYIHQTASSVYIAAGQRPTTVVQNSHTSGTPTSIDGRGLKENDLWIDTADQDSWDAALNFNWNDDLDYNWNDLRSDKIYVYRNGTWQLAIDGTILAEDTDLQVERDRIALLARSIDTLDGYARENFAQIRVRANEIYSEVLDKTNSLGSRITQTATQIRSEVHAANSQIYSEIGQTASNILLHVENEISGLGATMEFTAEQIRSDVYAAKSSLYSSISQTASQIRSEVVSTESSLRTTISQTASGIRSEVASTSSGLHSAISQEAARISLVVEGTGSNAKIKPASIVSEINSSGSSVVISADHVNLDGYVKATDITADYLASKIAEINVVNVNSLNSTGNIVAGSAGYVMAPYYYLGTSGSAQNMASSIRALRLSQNGDTYTLQKQDFDDANWVDVGSFSRATTLSGAWSGGVFKVTASPQGNTKSTTPLTISGSNNITSNGEYTYKLMYEDENQDDQETGLSKKITVNVPTTPSGSDIWIGVTGSVGSIYSSRPADTTGSSSKYVGIYFNTGGGWLCLRNGSVNYNGGTTYNKSVTLTYKGSVNGVYTWTTSTYVSGLSTGSRYTVHFNA